MIDGIVIAFDAPVITGKASLGVTVANPSDPQRYISFHATIDTGFTGFLTVRPGAISQLGLPFVANRQAVLADGSVGGYDVHAGRIDWYGQRRLIPIYSVDSEPLVGMALLWNSRLTMDIIPDGRVTITPVLP